MVVKKIQNKKESNILTLGTFFQLKSLKNNEPSSENVISIIDSEDQLILNNIAQENILNLEKTKNTKLNEDRMIIDLDENRNSIEFENENKLNTSKESKNENLQKIFMQKFQSKTKKQKNLKNKIEDLKEINNNTKYIEKALIQNYEQNENEILNNTPLKAIVQNLDKDPIHKDIENKNDKQILWSDFPLQFIHTSHTQLYSHNSESVNTFFQWLLKWNNKIEKNSKFSQKLIKVVDVIESPPKFLKKIKNENITDEELNLNITSKDNNQSKVTKEPITPKKTPKISKGQKTLFSMFPKSKNQTQEVNNEILIRNESTNLLTQNKSESKTNDTITNKDHEKNEISEIINVDILINQENKLKSDNSKRKRDDQFLVGRKRRKEDDSYVERESKKSKLRSSIILTGPVGSGKTHCIYTCAKELGFSVMEFNNSQNLSKQIVLQNVLEATQSYSFGSQSSKTLILFEHVDLLDINELDQGFFSALNQILELTKRPIVITCNNLNFLNQISVIDPQIDILYFKNNINDSMNEIKNFIFNNHFPISLSNCENDFKTFTHLLKGDTRKIINNFQFWNNNHITNSTLNKNICEQYLGASNCNKVTEISLIDTFTALKESLQNISHLNPLYYTYISNIENESIENINSILDCLSELDLIENKRCKSLKMSNIPDGISTTEVALQSILLSKLWDKYNTSLEIQSNEMNTNCSDSLKLSFLQIKNEQFIENELIIQENNIENARDAVRIGQKPNYEHIEILSNICHSENERKIRENKRRFYHHLQIYLSPSQIEYFTQLSNSFINNS